MFELFNTVLYEPIYNLLIFFYNIVPGNDIGLAIILLTVVVKAVLLPFSWQAVRSQKSLQDLQPKMDALRKEHKNDKEKLAQATMALYKENKVNPFSSCLPLLIQFPFLIAVYKAFRNGLTSDNFDLLYSFVVNPGSINSLSFNFVDMAVPSLALAVLAGGAQFIQTKMLMSKKAPVKSKGAKDENTMANMNKSMQYLMPVMTIFIGTRLPAGLTFYWFLTTVFTVLQQKIMFKKKNNDTPDIIPPSNQENNRSKKQENMGTQENNPTPPSIPKQIENK